MKVYASKPVIEELLLHGWTSEQSVEIFATADVEGRLNQKASSPAFNLKFFGINSEVDFIVKALCEVNAKLLDMWILSHC
jgi:hypothetical protein